MCIISVHFTVFDAVNGCDGAMGEAGIELIILSLMHFLFLVTRQSKL